jgi:hypothetical protein
MAIGAGVTFWPAEGELRAVLLAASIESAEAAELARHGVEVHGFERPPKLEPLAAAALEIRRRWPRATLIVSAPDRLTRRLREKYPPAIDVAVTSTAAELVLAAIVPP